MKAFFQWFIKGYKGFLFILAIGIGLFLHLYTQSIIGQLRNEARSLVQLYAGMHARVANEESPEDISFIFDHIIRKTNFPLILTDAEMSPTGWKGINVDPTDFSDEAIAKVKRMIRRMDREIEPEPIMYGDTVFSYLHYGDSRLIQQLRWLPTIEIGIVGLFVLVGFVGFASIKRSEQRHIWVGMAKETAHQLGTPISSLMGWLEILQSSRGKRNEAYSEMEKDLERLQLVITRFSQIGSKPDLKEYDIEKLLREAVAYIRRRAPQMGRRVVISEALHRVPTVALNKGLFQWAIENILKNSLDAMDKKDGRIEVRLDHDESGCTAVEIEDNGRGIEKSRLKRVFKPGFSTKKRGWGLGLSLARRIIEDYHGGRLFVKESRPGIGTTMRIEI